MKKTNLILILFLSMAVIFNACKKDDDKIAPVPIPTTTISKPVNFMKVGNAWAYEVTYEGEQYVDSLKITAVQTIDTEGKEMYTVIDDGDEGYWYLDNNYLSDDYLLKMINKNSKVGDVLEETGGTKREIISINEQVTVPAGTFNCVKIKITQYSDIVFCWIDRNNGIIKTEEQFEDEVYYVSKLKWKNF